MLSRLMILPALLAALMMSPLLADDTTDDSSVPAAAAQDSATEETTEAESASDGEGAAAAKTSATETADGVWGTLVGAKDAVGDTLRSQVAPPLKSIQHPIDLWLGELPMSVAMVCCIGLFVIALIWVWGLPVSFIFRDAPGSEWWRDLRIWATLVVLPYIAVYLWLGR